MWRQGLLPPSSPSRPRDFQRSGHGVQGLERNADSAADVQVDAFPSAALLTSEAARKKQANRCGGLPPVWAQRAFVGEFGDAYVEHRP